MFSRHTALSIVLIASATTFALTGCFRMDGDAQGDDEFRSALPASEAMALSVPDSEGSGALAVGDPSVLYQLTHGVSRSVNAHVATMLGWIRLVTLFPPSERGEDYRVWGPTEPEGLENVSWRLTVRRITEGRYELTLDGRPKGSTSDADFLPVLAGEVTPGPGGGIDSTGTLNLLFDNSNTLQSDPCRTGTIRVDWDASGGERVVDVAWDQFVNTCEGNEFLDVTYHYAEAEDASGSFEFAAIDDIHEADENKPEKEEIRINSRWLSDGTGRSDVVLSGPEIAADLAAAGLEGDEVQGSQCWSELFVLTWADTAPDELEPHVFENVGEESACPFQTPEYPQL